MKSTLTYQVIILRLAKYVISTSCNVGALRSCSNVGALKTVQCTAVVSSGL